MRIPIKSETPADSSIAGSVLDADRQRAFDVAVEHWPSIKIGFDQFCSHLRRLGYLDELPKHPSSVYLCAACISGGDAACKVFEATYFTGLRRFISKFDARPEVVEDLLQQLRTRLFVGPKARVASYEGRGSLQGWLRGVARSIAVDFLRLRKSRREDSWCTLESEVAVSEGLCAGNVSSPEEEYLLERDTRTLLWGLRRALLAVSEGERQLLHHYFVSGLTIDALAPLYAVNRSTIARRILRNLARIRRELRREVAPHLGPLEPGELQTWVPRVYQRLELDAGALLAG